MITPESRAVAKAVIVDGLARRLTVEDACVAAGLSRRTYYNYRDADSEFADACDLAIEDAAQAVNSRRVAEWRAELSRVEAELTEIESGLTEVGALAMTGDADAAARRDELLQGRQAAQEAVQALQLAIASGENYVERQARERAERERQAAESEAAELAEQQSDAAARVDAALRELEAGWSAFVNLAGARQSAARRAGGRGRAAYAAQLAQATLLLAPGVANALNVSRSLRARGGSPLSETVS